MIETTNLKLQKAELNESYSLSQHNDNLDKIDKIIESGSNPNGRWVKFTDGTLICQRTVNPNRDIKTNQTFSFPVLFVGDPSVSASHYVGINSAYQLSCGTMFLSHDENNWVVAFPNTTVTGANLSMYLTVIGRWK